MLKSLSDLVYKFNMIYIFISIILYTIFGLIGIFSAKKINFVIVRENSEGEYSGSGGIIHKNLSNEVGTEIAIFTKKGCNRIHEYAFQLANSRPARRLTLITKSNAQRHGMKIWDKSFYEIQF